jgi:NAD+ diphosphatase
MSERIFLFAGQDIYLPAGDSAGAALAGPGVPERLASGLAQRGRRDYGSGHARFAALSLDDGGAAEAAARGLIRVPLRQAIGLFADDLMRPALKGLALLNWLEGARFCGSCGSPLEDVPETDEEQGSRRCPACGRPHFPRISPAAIVLVRRRGERGPEALLARNARFPPGRFGLLAGFVEAGETLEETAVREVREEAGIEITGLRYSRSQPWPFPDSLMIAFTADWAGGEARPDGREIAELRWCLPGDLPGIPPPGSVARALIDDFAAGAVSGLSPAPTASGSS